MTIKKVGNNKQKPWLLDAYPNGRDKNRVRKHFATKGEAVQHEKYLLKQANEKPSLDDKGERRKLVEIVQIWHSLYGSTLANEGPIYSKMIKMAHAMGNPTASTFNAKTFGEFRGQRLRGDIIFTDERWNKGAPCVSTLNSELRRFKGIFNKLIELEEWKGPNPLGKIKPLKEHETEMGYLTNDQLTELLEHVKAHKLTNMYKIVVLCLSTGARWNEAAKLERSQLKVSVDKKSGKKTFMVSFIKNKSKKNRSIPISEEVYQLISEGTSARLFEEDCYHSFRYILNKLALGLPKGQATHVLRHTFASHFMMNGGNILVLRDILGHSDITMTMRYAHFAPDHLTEAITFNPLSNF
ncbi:integrase [Vibrio inusitatus NBRC 102082]|uniref:Integrase n=1 Tax=Vibrio inusitatus NBRC 102082 TaxID=1219070 RepID=A0A4Y3HW51_9VIBR|nr:tyrosine-type recombinase/integrase [Vibrio inusitatus]GEA51399.1 integrase [Vibrio inusitatus NBRC 102082]